MTLLIQDGRRGGHMSWAITAIGQGVANGAFISPFHTPRVAIPHHRSGATVADAVQAAGGEVIFDASTHARLLPTSDDLAHYDTWQLWGPSGVGLDSDARRLEHIELVFGRQADLTTPALAPTQTLDSPLGPEARNAMSTAQLARGINVACWQSLAGRRSFWRAGTDLDAYVGQLAALRSPCWVLTVVNDTVFDNIPDCGDAAAFAGLLRTVHSLSERSRVIVCYSDYIGLLPMAAGADSIGTGWDRGMRYFDPQSFQVTSSGIQIAASYVTQGNLAAVLRRDAADGISLLGMARATQLRGGPMPANEAAERVHHFRQLNTLATSIRSQGDRVHRVRLLREFYEQAALDFTALLGQLPRPIMNNNHKRRWNDELYTALRVYAQIEGIW